MAESRTNIKICVRIRPEQGHEKSPKFREIVKPLGASTVVFDPPGDDGNNLKKIFTSQQNKDLKFAFDHVFGPESSQLDVYRNTTAPILDDVLQGYNCCVFAYGATGAGKTFTMLGNPENPGVIFKTVMMLYQKIEACSDQFAYDLDISYVEIYNETLKDLLSPGRKLFLTETSDGIVTLRNVSLHQPKSADELLEMLIKGNELRTQSSTSANAESSRSHAIFQIYLRGRARVTGTTATWRHSKFSLIDLAGSERGSVSVDNKQQKEGANINRSLLALGNVINALAKRKNNPKTFVPYRDSKLTRLLKDSIGGSCQTVMIANVSPSSSSYEDTYNTLKYANRAKNIKVELVENVVEVTSHIAEYETIIKNLKAEVSSLKAKLDEKDQTSERLRLLEEFNTAHGTFDAKCSTVFKERALLKRELTVLEAEQQNTATLLGQKEAFLRMARTLQSSHIHQLQTEVDKLQSERTLVEGRIAEKREQLTANMERANGVQKEIHEYIQFNADKIPKTLGCQLLVQLWEFHLVKVQSYFAEHSVQALQQANLTCQRQLQIVSSVTEQLIDLAASNENIPPPVKRKLEDLVGGLLDGNKKRAGVMWADNQPTGQPSSDLFPSPQLVQPSSPALSFTPGKTLVGSTPQLNKLQNAYVHGEGFNTPAPPRLQACFRARFTPSAAGPETRVNLKARFSEVSSILKSPRSATAAGPSLVEEEEEGEESEGSALNSTFTLEEPTKPVVPTPRKVPVVKRLQAPKRKMSMIPGPMTTLPKRNTLVSPFPKSTSPKRTGNAVPRTATGRPIGRPVSTLRRPANRVTPKAKK